MNYSNAFIPTLREVPADAVIASHRLMFRAGMIRKLANGLFAYLPLGLRVFRKVEQIIREEMNAAGALEMRPPVVQPGEIWNESGRWDSMGEAMLRVKNRLNNDFVIAPTAEEAFTAIVRDELSSYRQLPLTLYQINTKYRDEIRPRYGVMRGREFVMKDAYSWHCDDESLDKTYQAMEQAYRKIFKRCGLSVIPVKADSGAMGGSGSEEFMVESEIGDNTLILCKNCDYAANVEKATCAEDQGPGIRDHGYGIRDQEDEAATGVTGTLPDEKVGVPNSQPDGNPQSPQTTTTDPRSPIPDPQLIDTPNVKTIGELCAFLKMDPKQFIKTIVYKAVNVEIEGNILSEAFFAVAIRGDIEVNEAKLAALLKAGEVHLASDSDVVRLTNAPVGFAGPVGLTTLPIIVDHTVTGISDGVTGALVKDKHYLHVAYGRDFSGWMTGDVRTVKPGDRCALCGGELYEKKGNELGHIFKLGYKYTRSMGVSYLDESGISQIPTMGCYGIGVDRTLASIIEEHHDEAGIVWPVSVAPWHVIIIPIKYEGDVKTASDRLAAELEKAGIEVLLDDRNERPGVKFNDADLIGIPWRVVVGDKGLAQPRPQVEVKRRGEKENSMIDLDNAAEELAAKVRGALKES